MNASEIIKAEQAAKVFLARVEEYSTEMRTQKLQGYTPYAPKQSGALRRASMELTRQLSQMRKP